MACRIFKVVSLVALAVAGFSSALMAQVDQQVMDASAEQAQGNYTPMNLGYAGFNSLGMTQAAWLDPLETSAKAKAVRHIPDIIGRLIWFCLSACVRE